jgi:hypothetical protein
MKNLSIIGSEGRYLFVWYVGQSAVSGVGLRNGNVISVSWRSEGNTPKCGLSKKLTLPGRDNT